MHTRLTINVSGKVKRATWNGRDWYIANAVSIVEGVLPGSDGPLFYPRKEIIRNPKQWDGMPVVVYHPFVNGQPVSAAHPKTHNQRIGFLTNTSHEIGSDGATRLKHEVWFDIDRTREVDPRVLNSLENNQPIELSTGLFTKQVPVQNGSWKGRSYHAIAINYRPDHLAVLPDQRGACSLNDGCGVLVNTAMVEKPVVEQPKQNFFEAAGSFFSGLFNAQPRHPIDGTFQGLTTVAATTGHKTIHEDIQQYADRDVKEKAKAAAKLEGNPNETPEGRTPLVPVEPDPVATDRTPKKIILGTTTTNDFNAGKPDMEPDKHDASLQAATQSMQTEHPPARENAMAALDQSKAGNSKKAASLHTKAAEAHEQAATDSRKNKEPDNAAMHDQAALANRVAASMHTASIPAPAVPTQPITNTVKPTGKTMTKDQFDSLVANCTCEKTKAALIANAPNFSGQSNDTTTTDAQKARKKKEDAGRDDSLDNDPEPAKDVFTGNATMNREQFLELAKHVDFGGGVSALDILKTGARKEKTDRAVLINRLVANVSNQKAKEAKVAFLSKKSTEELQDLVELLPPVRNTSTIKDGFDFGDVLPPVFTGAGAGGAMGAEGETTTTNDNQANVLDIPTINYNESPEVSPGILAYKKQMKVG